MDLDLLLVNARTMTTPLNGGLPEGAVSIMSGT